MNVSTRGRFAPLARSARLCMAGAASLIVAAAPTAPLSGQTLSLDTASLGAAPHSRMTTLLERTLFKVDVLTLDVRLGRDESQRVGDLIAGRDYSESLADSVARLSIDATDALVRTEFQRDVSLDQFLDGIEDNMRHALRAGIIDRAAFDTIRSGLPRWFAFLRERGIHDGDEIIYRIRGDTLRTVFRSSVGRVLLDQRDVGRERRRSVMGSYFARGSEFRNGLIESLFRESRP